MNKNYKVYLNAKANNMNDLFSLIGQFAEKENVVRDKNDFINALKEREKVGSTGLENSIAIPHGISDKVLKHFIFIVRIENSIEWKTFDNSKVKTVICFAVPKKTEGNHLQVLQKVSVMLLDKNNQNLLNNGDVNSISKLFDAIEIEPSKITIENTASNQQVVNTQQSEEEDETNLVELKDILIKKLAKTNDPKLRLEIKKVDQQIANCKSNIEKIKVKWRVEKEKLKNAYQRDKSSVDIKVKKESIAIKSQLENFKTAIAKEKLQLEKKNLSGKAKKDAFNQFNYQLYMRKNKIVEPLNQVKFEKAKIVGNFKTNKTNLNQDMTRQLKFNNYKIVNPKNYFYIHGNKIQLVLMLILAVIGLWAIVLGSIGVGTFRDFVTSNINLWAGLEIPGFDQAALDKWASTIVANNGAIASAAIAFGVFSIALIIPMKIFKIQGVIYEKQAIATTGLSIIFIIVAFALVLLSIDNIKNFELHSGEAIKLNHHFANALALDGELKKPADFTNQTDYNLYMGKIQGLLREYGFDVEIADINDDLRILALDEAKIAAMNDFNKIVLGVSL